jgi:hypothetical protein
LTTRLQARVSFIESPYEGSNPSPTAKIIFLPKTYFVYLLYKKLIKQKQNKMKKVIAIFAIATTLVSCGGGVSNNPTTDSTTVKTDSVTVDSTTVKTDSTVNTK